MYSVAGTYPTFKDEKIKVENFKTKKVIEIKKKRDADSYSLSPDGKYIAYSTGRFFTKFDKDTFIINSNGRKVYKIEHCSGISDWK